MVNPMELISMIRGGKNPQQLAMNVLQSEMNNTPFGANLMNMAQQGNGRGIEQFARNYVSSQGRDFDTEFRAFKQQLGL